MNTSKKIISEELQQHQRISNYYQFQSKIYDLTRWSFLFGRLQLLKCLPFEEKDHFCIAEIGCGTGFNLKYIAKKYSNATIIGVDVSKDMQHIAQEKLAAFSNHKVFHQTAYTADANFLQPVPDVILFSYALTMINPQWRELILKAYEDLPKGGKVLVVDFHNSRLPFFKKHMGRHHVRMDGHILPVLKEKFKPIQIKVKSAYGGIWQYFIFVGSK
ncbi:MAG: class I SAM-dependent methyltransferase [Bacteroidota bacterium]